MSCTHNRWDQMAALTAGHCPSCLLEENKQLENTIDLNDKWAAEMVPKCEGLEEENKQVVARLEAGTLHRLVCNADQSKPTGGDMCICNPLKARIAAALAEVEALRARAALGSLDSRALVKVLRGE